MGLISTGTDVARNTVFNAGYITIDSKRLVDLDNVSVDFNFAVKDLRTIGSIKARVLKRATFKTGLKGKVKSYNKEVLNYIAGSSSPDVGGTLYSVKDGQQAAPTNILFTTYIGDDTTQPVQFQFSGAVIKTFPVSQKTEDYGEMDFELDAIDVNVYYGAVA